MPTSHLTVWYNTRCPICSGGIDWQRNKLLAAVRAGTVEKDINAQPDALTRYGASLDDIRRRLHATDQVGRLIVGADVAIALWQLTPGEKWLAALLGNRVTLPATRFVYDRFADWLFAWNTRIRAAVNAWLNPAYFFLAPTRLRLLIASAGRPLFSAISRSCSMMYPRAGSSPSSPPSSSEGTRRLERWEPSS